jgi:hypothetical protein
MGSWAGTLKTLCGCGSEALDEDSGTVFRQQMSCWWPCSFPGTYPEAFPRHQVEKILLKHLRGNWGSHCWEASVTQSLFIISLTQKRRKNVLKDLETGQHQTALPDAASRLRDRRNILLNLSCSEVCRPTEWDQENIKNSLFALHHCCAFRNVFPGKIYQPTFKESAWGNCWQHSSLCHYTNITSVQELFRT